MITQFLGTETRSYVGAPFLDPGVQFWSVSVVVLPVVVLHFDLLQVAVPQFDLLHSQYYALE